MSGHASEWDECWKCPSPSCHTGIAVGNGKRGGGNAVVTFTAPPHCTCGREMEQVTNLGVDPDEMEGSR